MLFILFYLMQEINICSLTLFLTHIQITLTTRFTLRHEINSYHNLNIIIDTNLQGQNFKISGKLVDSKFLSLQKLVSLKLISPA